MGTLVVVAAVTLCTLMFVWGCRRAERQVSADLQRERALREWEAQRAWEDNLRLEGLKKWKGEK